MPGETKIEMSNDLGVEEFPTHYYGKLPKRTESSTIYIFNFEMHRAFKTSGLNNN